MHDSMHAYLKSCSPGSRGKKGQNAKIRIEYQSHLDLMKNPKI